ncbi:TonB-dependent receptor [Alteromonas sp. KUL49]|uniref:TonB-dependent receptor plug domain-containing protein n=1 Tax=Alteromonas sp. KUL49 TaxID=2480798 RepID=UPI00102EF29D|nr:TonB-dependent receptor [Alteromonas sp. KUL49]TAP42464.1 TonB-dependent receptor [Alteromonas sp. KUL49]GEA10086.1 ligand-gated channel [Alteromonas sp. KUL49]
MWARLSLAVLLLSSPSLGSAASASSDVDLFELSLEELLNVEITVESVKSRRSSDTFSSIGKVTQGQWRTFDAERVFDTLKYEPSMDLYMSVGGSTTLSTRGYTGDSSSSRGKALLFDGIPLNGFAFGTALYSKSFLPTELLSGIEVVRGPISSMHGPDAFHGAILMTPSLYEEPGHSLEASSDNYGQNEVALKSSVNVAEDIKSISLLHTTHLDDNFSPSNLTTRLNSEQKSYTLFNKIAWQRNSHQHEAGLLLNRASAAGYFDLFSTDTSSGVDGAETSLLYYKGQFTLTDWNVSAKTWVHDSVFDLRFRDESFVQFWNDRQYGAQLIGTNDSLTDASVSIGTEFIKSKVVEARSHLASDPPRFASGDGLSKNVFALFGQYTQLLTDNLTLDAGLRVDRFSNSGETEVSPKIGLIYRSSDVSSWKLSAARGYRAPAAGELSSGNFLGNPELKGETLTTVEATYQFQNEFAQIKVTLFDSMWEDGIITQLTDEATSMGFERQFVNAGSNSAYGLELEQRYYFSDHDIYVQSGYSYVKSKNETSNTDYTAFPEHKFSIGIVHQLNSYQYALHYLLKTDRTDTLLSEVTLPNFHDVHFSIQREFKNSSVIARVSNLLNSTQVDPAIWGVDGGIEGRGRKFELSFLYSF